jgi:hypothetical protein
MIVSSHMHTKYDYGISWICSSEWCFQTLIRLGIWNFFLFVASVLIYMLIPHFFTDIIQSVKMANASLLNEDWRKDIVATNEEFEKE